MTLQTPLRVHIAPQGYEEERIYKPAIESRADVVYLLVTEDDEQSNQCQEAVEQNLADAGIECKETVCDIFDMSESMQTISGLIQDHRDDNVKVNISTGSKITAVGGTFACMMYGATPYYVQAEDYGEETVSVGVKDSFELPAYPIEPPEPEFVSILDFLEEQRSEGNKVKIRDLNTFVMEKEFDAVQGVERKDNDNIYDIVQEEYREPLSKEGFIREQPYAGSKYITLTEKGEQTLDFSRHLVD
ncbi:unknown [Haloarcula marismortui ATCC 43049]|uniref:CRISPR-associated protein n=1 Tax=Haloarcula marismortui (strain ATCC 43049 / DSM 3752 / JCM 8966 / VKM B-1809) TaxID=272569 RepID=Q5UZV2_HALMA|nr:DUF6293 family protein [Haloarcula marismortui]AAV47201.1 unknown [Haloarcula marismortui ATCC 43049]QCP91904.1 hypothetical protein E6P14_13955 [Haloarcula marismortui ATCC 43049]